MKRFMLIPIVLVFVAAPAMADMRVAVSAYDLWTGTGIDITIGDAVTVTPVAGDMWTTTGAGPVGPSGFNFNDWDLFSSVDNGSLHSSMIAYIGDDPFQGHWGDGSFWPQATGYIAVNDGVTFTSSVSGRLWLGVNDDAESMAIGDNSGSIRADVDVVPVPGAVLLGVLGLGVAGLKLRKRA